jgi:glycosyltransferase involved in cell wall biosynthesis
MIMPRPSTEDVPLAIIIPAFKTRHLARTLESLARQTDPRFRVYIGDDASPENLAPIVAAFRRRLDLVYHRFPENLGRTSLVQHWDRTIAMSREPWLWVFSDDDMMSPECVGAFLEQVARGADAHTLYRFNLRFIDAEDRVIADITPFPRHQTWSNYVQVIIEGRCEFWVVLQNIVFSRQLYQEQRGFSEFPLGLFVDVVTWARFSHRGGIVTMPQGRVWYRRHTDSIGGNIMLGHGDRTQWIRGLGWMIAEFRRLCAERGGCPGAGRGAQLSWFCQQFSFLTSPITREEWKLVSGILRRLWPGWLGIREIWFWQCALRVQLRRQRWFRLLTALRTRLRSARLVR